MIHFLSCDWGTTFLRLRLIDAKTLTILSEENDDKGIATVYQMWKQSGNPEKERIVYYGSFLHKYIQEIGRKSSIPLQQVPLIISGMASSTMGMLSIPYREIPFLTDGSNLEIREIPGNEFIGYRTIIISGVSTGSDIMRGEETKLIGSVYPHQADEEHLYIFPGTHSKHVIVKNGQVNFFKTYMTGEFFWLLTEKSVLGTSVQAGGEFTDQKNLEAFRNGVLESRQQNLLNSCFHIRTNIVLEKSSAEENYFFLSGLLMGTELKDFSNFPPGLTIVGNELFNMYYRKALEMLGYAGTINVKDADEALIRGQWLLLKQALEFEGN